MQHNIQKSYTGASSLYSSALIKHKSCAVSAGRLAPTASLLLLVTCTCKIRRHRPKKKAWDPNTKSSSCWLHNHEQRTSLLLSCRVLGCSWRVTRRPSMATRRASQQCRRLALPGDDNDELYPSSSSKAPTTTHLWLLPNLQETVEGSMVPLPPPLPSPSSPMA